MDSIVPHLNGLAKVTFRPYNLPTLLLGMYSDFCHLLVQLNDHRAEPTWQGISTKLCHLVHCVQLLHYAVDLKLLTDDLVISLAR
jgi:hypothetical protein